MPDHSDQPTVSPDGVRDLTDEEYDATYTEGEPHTIPPDVLERVEAVAAAIRELRQA